MTQKVQEGPGKFINTVRNFFTLIVIYMVIQMQNVTIKIELRNIKRMFKEACALGLYVGYKVERGNVVSFTVCG